ncbi:efflux RND transporter periplasmic adaptor subunit [Pedobacter sp. Hv1]|uniref:efflux RND transporter periplasmic adaptor subunit n=1 Tax=Pedobacter sp. Hv1 TaxID=1740090 RepID=UPI0006D8D6FC|nr:efflux RND transporter periplasmic adaptor subunit [Pedobacter sp. Hv1]KQC00730.1 cation transporter [Pedobacter sp. Hv1]
MQFKQKQISIYFIPLALLMMQSCSQHKTPVVAEKFEITDSLLNRLLIDTVQQANSKTDLSFSAKITEDQERKSEIFPMVSGTLRQISVKVGDQVNKGQTLATMSSAEMAGFDKEEITAGSELKNAERNLKQAEALFENGLSSAKELEEAKNEYEIKKAELKRASSVLKLNGGNKIGLYAIKSPINGFIIEKNANSNMQIRSDFGKSLFTVADLSAVWAMINIYESDIAKLKEGDQVNISVLAYPEKVFTGKIDKLYSLIDQDSKVMKARVSINNPGYTLKPGMLATVKVAASTGTNLPVVNARAIIFDDNKNYVLVIDPNKKVRVQEIELGRKTADKAYISKGLNAGDQVISSKQVFLFESLKK